MRCNLPSTLWPKSSLAVLVPPPMFGAMRCIRSRRAEEHYTLQQQLLHETNQLALDRKRLLQQYRQKEDALEAQLQREVARLQEEYGHQKAKEVEEIRYASGAP